MKSKKSVTLIVVIAIMAMTLLGVFEMENGLGLMEVEAASAGPPGSDVVNVTVTAENASPSDAEASLEVIWNSRAQSAVDPDPDDSWIYNANEGQKYLVFRMTIKNTDDNNIDLTPRLFRVESKGVEYEYQGLFGSGNSFSGITLNPGASYSAWTAFQVPESMTEARLFVYQDAYYQKNVAVSFIQDTDMAINMSDGNGGTPGFGLALLIMAIVAILLIKRRRGGKWQ